MIGPPKSPGTPVPRRLVSDSEGRSPQRGIRKTEGFESPHPHCLVLSPP